MLTLNSVIQNLKNSGNKNIIAVYKSIIYNQLSRHVWVLFDLCKFGKLNGILIP